MYNSIFLIYSHINYIMISDFIRINDAEVETFQKNIVNNLLNITCCWVFHIPADLFQSRYLYSFIHIVMEDEYLSKFLLSMSKRVR